MGVSKGVSNLSRSAGVEASANRRVLNKVRSDAEIRAFITKSKAGKATKNKLFDGGALYLTLTPAGTPVWRVKYRLGGKEGVYAVGIYPAITLNAARDEREAVKALLRNGRDPVQNR